MYHAFYLFEQDALTPAALCKYKDKLLPRDRESAMVEFRQPLQAIKESHQVARELLASFRPCPSLDWQEQCEKRQVDPCEFRQGSDTSSYTDERPQHRVRLTPFQMQATTVTRAQYRLFDERFESSPEKSSWGEVISESIRRYSGDGKVTVGKQTRDVKGDDCPIINVDWYDAFMFAKFLGPEYRLPTEAEWEFACRAGRDGPDDEFHFSEGLTRENANFGYTLKRTTPAGIYPLNAFQLDQMHGNVWEWTADWYDENNYRTVSQGTAPAVDPAGPSVGSSRVLRGGSLHAGTNRCRSARRHLGATVYRVHSIGFRVVVWFGVSFPSSSS